MTYRALLIGNSVFDADAGLNPLNAPTKDVARLHRALVDSTTGLFADENVRLVIERSSDELLDELDAFFGAGQRDDLLLLYYSGHGLLDERNQLFLCGRNTRSDRLLRTAVSNVRINEFIDQSVARCTVIVLDCCSSGMFKGGDVSAPLAGPGRYVVSSTRGAALANDAALPTGTSLFTEHLVTGLLGAAEDHDGDGYLDLREIFDYVRRKLTATTKQIPHCRFDGDAAVMLAKRPAAPLPTGTTVAAGRIGDPTFVLSENMITLNDVAADERLSPETIEIYPLTDREVDCTAETDATWLTADVDGGRVTIGLHPRPGHNRGKIIVRDRRSGTGQVVRVHVTVEHRGAPAPPPVDDQTRRRVPPPRPGPPGPSRGGDTPPPSPGRDTAPPGPGRDTAPPGPGRDSTPPKKGGGRRSRWMLAGIAAGVLLITGTAAWLLRPDSTPQQPVTTPVPVPTLVGLTRADAEATLARNGLAVTVVPASSGAICSPGAVTAQNPAAGQAVGRGTLISLTVCGQSSSPSVTTTTSPTKTTGTTPGRSRVTVPDLGSSCESAKAALHRVGLFGRCQERDSSSTSIGNVIGSDFPPGSRVPARSTIVVFISKGIDCPGPDPFPPDPCRPNIDSTETTHTPPPPTTTPPDTGGNGG